MGSHGTSQHEAATWTVEVVPDDLKSSKKPPDLHPISEAIAVAKHCLLKSNWLVVSTPLKNISQNGNLPQVGVKIKHV